MKALDAHLDEIGGEGVFATAVDVAAEVLSQEFEDQV